MLLAYGADPNSADRYGHTSLMNSVVNGHAQIVEVTL